jgi:hypothetical protein
MKNDVLWDVTSCGSCKTDDSDESNASIIRVTRIGKQETLAVTGNRSKLRAVETSKTTKKKKTNTVALSPRANYTD